MEIILVCVRWYVAYPLSLRHLEEMMAERGVVVDHSTIHRWAIKMLPGLAAVCRRRKRPVGKSWRMDETYVKVGGQWKYLYRAVDKNGDTIDFLLRAKRDHAAARAFFERAIDSVYRARCFASFLLLISNPPSVHFVPQLWSTLFGGKLTALPLSVVNIASKT